jgi:hypothetical protein
MCEFLTYNSLNDIKDINKDVIFEVVTNICIKCTNNYLPYDLFCHIWNKIDNFDNETENHFIEDEKFYPNYYDIVYKGSIKRKKNKSFIRYKRAYRFHEF